VADALVGPKLEQESPLAAGLPDSGTNRQPNAEGMTAFNDLVAEIASVRESGDELSERMIEFAQTVMRSLSEFGTESQVDVPEFLIGPPKDASRVFVIEHDDGTKSTITKDAKKEGVIVIEHDDGTRSTITSKPLEAEL
jgi:hypothetical protein